MKKNIVLVDDSNFVRSTLKHTFSKIGFEVHEASSGEEILHSKRFNPSISTDGILDKIVPDLFILDVELDSMTGLDVLKKIKAHDDFKDTPVIVNSSHSDKNTIIAAITAGAADYVIKEDNYVDLLVNKVKKVFEKELGTFETTLKHELEWIKFGDKELSFALINLSDSSTKKPISEDCYKKITSTLKEKLRSYDWIFPLDEKSIAVILPLSSMQSIVILRKRFLDEIIKLGKEFKFQLNAQLGFSHFPTNAKTAKELIKVAEGQIK